jgi:hypothetical protein
VIEISEYQDKCLRQNIHANLFLGGGKGGSKTYAGCLLSVQHVELFGADANALVVRLTYDGAKEIKHDLMDIIRRKYDTDPRKFWNGDAKTFTFPSGGRIEVGYLNHEDDLLRYRGRSFSLLFADECADIRPELLNKLRSEIRAKKDVVTRMIGTANPARPYHSVWEKYATQNPWTVFLEDETELPWISCPSVIWDNPFVDPKQALAQMAKDPNFEALASGDWTLVSAENFFRGAWDDDRVIVDDWTHLPEYSWKYAIYCDHGGGSSPTAAIFTATALETARDPNGGFFPKGSIVVFDYHDDSTGLHTGNWNEVADGWSIARNCAEMVKIADGWNMHVRGKIDNQVEQNHGDESTLLDQYHKNGCYLEPWSKPRLENAAAVVREYLIQAQREDDRKLAGLYIVKSARGLIETIPYLPRHKSNRDCPETRNVPDHGYDCVKAVCWDRSQEWQRLPLQRDAA